MNKGTKSPAALAPAVDPGSIGMPGSTLTADEWIVEIDHCRIMLHIHGVISDSENDKAKRRILKRIKSALAPKPRRLKK